MISSLFDFSDNEFKYLPSSILNLFSFSSGDNVVVLMFSVAVAFVVAFKLTIILAACASINISFKIMLFIYGSSTIVKVTISANSYFTTAARASHSFALL